MGELHWFIHQEETAPEDVEKTLEALAYLEACHYLFERGFLCHERIRSVNSEVLKNINKGYRYFSGWLTDLLEQGIEYHLFLNVISCFLIDPQFPHTSNTQKEFLSWQSNPKCSYVLSYYICFV